jgi:hypothetical protein
MSNEEIPRFKKKHMYNKVCVCVAKYRKKVRSLCWKCSGDVRYPIWFRLIQSNINSRHNTLLLFLVLCTGSLRSLESSFVAMKFLLISCNCKEIQKLRQGQKSAFGLQIK